MAHERDAAWLSTVYLAIHGGDPAPKEGQVVTHDLQVGAALHAIAALSEALDEKARDAVLYALEASKKQFQMKSVDAEVAEARLKTLGIRITEYAGDLTEYAGDHPLAANLADPFRPARQYCFRFRGATICTQILSPDPHPEA